MYKLKKVTYRLLTSVLPLRTGGYPEDEVLHGCTWQVRGPVILSPASYFKSVYRCCEYHKFPHM